MFTPATPLAPQVPTPVDFTQYGLQQYEAVLMVFTPRVIPTQVSRPYILNFTSEVAGPIVHAKSAGEALSPSAPLTQAMCQAVMPASDGIVIDTKPLAEKWTFILMIDIADTGGVVNRYICSGFFIDEPVNPATMQMGMSPTINPHARMQFATTMQMTMSELITMGAPDSRLYVHRLDDVVSPASNVLSGNELFIMTPAQLARSSQMVSPDEMMVTYGDLSVGNTLMSQPNIPMRLKSPRHYMRDIGHGIDCAMTQLTQTAFVQNDMDRAFGSLPGFDVSPGSFHHNLMQNLTSYEHTNCAMGPIDTTKQLSLAELDRHYPHMKVQVMGTPAGFNALNRPQELICPQNTMSYMIANTISALAASCAISDITFRYSSRSTDVLNPEQGMWEIMEASMMIPGVPPMYVQSTVNRFLTILSRDLWPLIKLTNGDFDISVAHHSHCETYINLQLLDFGKADGWYIANNELSGITNPLLGADRHLEHNLAQLRFLADTYTGEALHPTDVPMSIFSLKQ